MSSSYLHALASGDAPLASEDVSLAAEGIDKAKFAAAKARLQLARLLDYALAHCDGLTDEDPIATDTFKAIAWLNDSFPSDTDVGTGLPLAQTTAEVNHDK